jgi:hypothetical protein
MGLWGKLVRYHNHHDGVYPYDPFSCRLLIATGESNLGLSRPFLLKAELFGKRGFPSSSSSSNSSLALVGEYLW